MEYSVFVCYFCDGRVLAHKIILVLSMFVDPFEHTCGCAHGWHGIFGPGSCRVLDNRAADEASRILASRARRQEHLYQATVYGVPGMAYQYASGILLFWTGCVPDVDENPSHLKYALFVFARTHLIQAQNALLEQCGTMFVKDVIDHLPSDTRKKLCSLVSSKCPNTCSHVPQSIVLID